MFDSLKCLFLEFFYLILVLLNLLRLHYINDLLNFWRWTTICLLEFFLEQVNDHLFSAVDRRKISYHDRVIWQGTSTFVVILLLFLYHVTDTNQGHKMNQEIYNLQKLIFVHWLSSDHRKVYHEAGALFFIGRMLLDFITPLFCWLRTLFCWLRTLFCWLRNLFCSRRVRTVCIYSKLWINVRMPQMNHPKMVRLLMSLWMMRRFNFCWSFMHFFIFSIAKMMILLRSHVNLTPRPWSDQNNN